MWTIINDTVCNEYVAPFWNMQTPPPTPLAKKKPKGEKNLGAVGWGRESRLSFENYN